MPHVTLLAMSGVRVVDPALRALGLTLPGFIERGKVIASMPSLGLLTLAGATPDHWSINYLEFDEIAEEGLAKLIAQRPDLVAVSSLAARIDDAYHVLDRLRAEGIRTALGGLHASVLPDEAQAHADAVVIGQGEWVWPQILEDVELGTLRPRYGSLHSPEPLESAPIPRFDLLDHDRYNRIPIQTTRGCPLDCAFCAASRLISPYKRKPIDRVRAELEVITALWPKPFIELADDNTFVHKRWAKELVGLFAEYPQIHWFTETDISVADDEELLGLLAQSGCAQLLIGLESVSTRSLSETDGRNWKAKEQRSYIEKIARIQDAGISVNGCFVFGFDHDEPDVFDRTWEFIQESGLSEVQLTLLTPFPGTALFERLRRDGRLLESKFWDRCTLFDVVFRPLRFEPEELATRFREMIARVYSPAESARRAAKRQSLYRLRGAHGSTH